MTLQTPRFNAHAHWEWTHAPLPPHPGFVEWVKALHEEVAIHSLQPLSLSLVHISPQAFPHFSGMFHQTNSTPILEILGSSRERALESLKAAQQIPDTIISPHSLYAVHPEILKDMLQRFRKPLSIHFLESAEEKQWWDSGNGSLADLVLERGGLRSQGKVWLRGQLLNWRQKTRAPLLLIHGNYVDEDDLKWMRELEAFVVHCPASHDYFRHQLFPLSRYLKARVPVLLGTDSLASNTLNSLNIADMPSLLLKTVDQPGLIPEWMEKLSEWEEIFFHNTKF